MFVNLTLISLKDALKFCICMYIRCLPTTAEFVKNFRENERIFHKNLLTYLTVFEILC